MNDKVGKLVEEVDELLRDVFRHYNKGEMVSTEKVAKQILSHPNLSLIDRDKTPPPERWEGIPLSEEVTSIYLRVIPLAKVLKEVNND